MAAKTWGEEWYAKTKGCGSVWDAMVYDPESDQLIIGTGGASPFNPTERGEGAGDELFVNAVVALNADNGEYQWHFSQVPGDGWNYEAAVGLMLATVPIGEQDKRVVISVPKNGFVYLLDAITGEFISGRKYVPVTWATGLDEISGRPIFDPAARYWEKPDERSIILPSVWGAHGWAPLAFDPQNNRLYIPSMTNPDLRGGSETEQSDDIQYGSRGDPDLQVFGELIAWDPLTQTELWRQRHALPINGGVVHTAGGLVFQGTAEGYLNAYDAVTGERLASFEAGGAIRGAPSTVMVDGRQYIIVPAGAPSSSANSSEFPNLSPTLQSRSRPRLLAFALGGEASTPAWADTVFPIPPVDRFSVELETAGRAIYNSCVFCHGLNVESIGGSAPDLRMRLPPNLEYLTEVLRGALAPAMPAIPLGENQVEALYAYLVNTAWRAYEQ